MLADLRDRNRHPKRHADVRRRLEQLGQPRTILVVCAANMCRSPYLEGVLKRALPTVATRSAGFSGADRPVPPHALAISAKRGVDLSSFRSSTIQPRIARQADLVIVMDQNQATYLALYMGVSRGRIIVAGDLDSRTSHTRAIEDPWQKSVEEFESAFDRLDRCAVTLTEILGATSKSQSRNSSMPNPASHAAHPSASVAGHFTQLST
jgi:protein-tyrosine phosphatase